MPETKSQSTDVPVEVLRRFNGRDRGTVFEAKPADAELWEAMGYARRLAQPDPVVGGESPQGELASEPDAPADDRAVAAPPADRAVKGKVKK